MDLSTEYLGLRLRNLIVASASPLSYTVEGIRALAEAGVGAVVLHSLFEEELVAESERWARLAAAGVESYAESLSYLPIDLSEEPGPTRYLSLVERAKRAVDLPVIGSLNGVTAGGWTEYARAIEEAGADGIELNLYSLSADLEADGREVERRHLEIVERVRAAVTVPVAVKVSPHYSSISEMAQRFAGAGASGLVLFSRFLHPDIDAESLQVVPGIGLSSASEARLPRTWIALLRGRVNASLAATTGVDGPEDVAKYLLAGADVVMVASALLRHGLGQVATLLEGVEEWMARKGFGDLAEVRGLLAVRPGADAAVDERTGYVTAMQAANANAAGPW